MRGATSALIDWFPNSGMHNLVAKVLNCATVQIQKFNVELTNVHREKQNNKFYTLFYSGNND